MASSDDKPTAEDALNSWVQYRRLGLSPTRVAELAPQIQQRLLAIEELWEVDTEGVELAVSFVEEAPLDVP